MMRVKARINPRVAKAVRTFRDKMRAYFLMGDHVFGVQFKRERSFEAWRRRRHIKLVATEVARVADPDEPFIDSWYSLCESEMDKDGGKGEGYF